MPSSDIARNDVLGSTTYPDGGIATYLVNRQSQVKQFTDQRQVVHVYQFDLLGRQVEDLVTSLGSHSSSSSSSSSSGASSGIDGTIQRIARTYEVRGLLQNVTSYTSPVIGQGAVVNDVQRVYNAFEQLATEYQEHSGAVNTSTSVNVQYQNVDGSSNTIRPTALIYPNGRILTYSYGVSGGIDDALSRIASLIDSDGVTHLADYTRLGRGTFVQQSSPQPQIAWSLVNGAGADPYTGLDQFNRIIDNRWYSTASSSSSSSSSSSGNYYNADLDRIQHGYDRASNRLWRKNTVAEAADVYLDELYSYDGLYRLAEMQRGRLNASNNAIVGGSLDFAQAWGLDATGNFAQFWQNGTGGSWTLQQTRAASRANEITGIIGGDWVAPGYDTAGNMTLMPQPSAPTAGYSAVYDAWSRLVLVSSDGSQTQQQSHDGMARRITELVSGVMRHYYYSSRSRDVEERLTISGPAARQFVWGLRYIDQLVLRDRGTERLYAIHDVNWNISAICSSIGNVSERYVYTAYGVPGFLGSAFVPLTSSAYSWDILFGGYRYADAIKLYDARLRFLHSLLGTWLSRDPLPASVIEEWNPYRYCFNSPIELTDPSGSAPINVERLPKCGCDECEKCWDDAIGGKDKRIENIIKQMKRGPFWRSGCKPTVKCCCREKTGIMKKGCDECRGSSSLGSTEKQRITICANNIPNTKGIGQWSECSGLWETMAHELLHLLGKCRKFDPGGMTPCEKLLCDEVRSYRQSGQCEKGSVWWERHSYSDTDDCLAKSAAGSAASSAECFGVQDLEKVASGLVKTNACKDIPLEKSE